MPGTYPTHLKHAEISDHILCAFFEVYNRLEPGLAETAYERAMVQVLRARGCDVLLQQTLTVRYGRTACSRFRPDFMVDGKVLVEVKATSRIIKSHWAQLLNYLRASRVEVGLILNFGPRPEFKRLVL